MGLGTRLSRLEQKKGIGGVLMAFIGVPDGAHDIFGEAQIFWDREREGHPNGNILCAVPWPHFRGKETEILGIGTHDDLYCGLCGGVRDPANSTFIFLGDVADLIKSHYREVKEVMNTHEKDRGDLEVSEEAVKILLCMVGAKER